MEGTEHRLGILTAPRLVEGATGGLDLLWASLQPRWSSLPGLQALGTHLSVCRPAALRPRADFVLTSCRRMLSIERGLRDKMARRAHSLFPQDAAGHEMDIHISNPLMRM